MARQFPRALSGRQSETVEAARLCLERELNAAGSQQHPLVECALVEFDVGRLEIDTSVDDPGADTEPITCTPTFMLTPDGNLPEYFCKENEKDIERYR